MSDNWPNERLETVYKEARAVCEAQNKTMADIDNKAIQTVRLNTILIGLLLAAANAADPSIFAPKILGGSIFFLVISVIAGLATYNESDLYVGAKGDYIEELVIGETADPWHDDILKSFAGMVTKNSNEIEWNSTLLTVTQASLVIGIVLAILSIII